MSRSHDRCALVRSGREPVNKYWKLVQRASAADNVEEQILEHVTEVPVHVLVEPEPAPQRMREMPQRPPPCMRHTRPLMLQQTANTFQTINSWQHALPPPRPGCAWALVASGSAPHVAPRATLLSGATLQSSRSQGSACTTANGSPTPNRWQFDIDATARKKDINDTHVQHASVVSWYLHRSHG